MVSAVGSDPAFMQRQANGETVAHCILLELQDRIRAWGPSPSGTTRQAWREGSQPIGRDRVLRCRCVFLCSRRAGALTSSTDEVPYDEDDDNGGHHGQDQRPTVSGTCSNDTPPCTEQGVADDPTRCRPGRCRGERCGSACRSSRPARAPGRAPAPPSGRGTPRARLVGPTGPWLDATGLAPQGPGARNQGP